jgi:hypothetical protein
MPDLSQMHKGRDTQKIPFSEVPNGSGKSAGEVDLHGVQTVLSLCFFSGFMQPRKYSQGTCGAFLFLVRPEFSASRSQAGRGDALWMDGKSLRTDREIRKPGIQ